MDHKSIRNKRQLESNISQAFLIRCNIDKTLKLSRAQTLMSATHPPRKLASKEIVLKV